MQDNKLDFKSLYKNMSLAVGDSLGMLRELIDHAGMKGFASERYWIELLKQYLPIKYGVDSGKVVDSSGNTSRQIDIIIYDQEAFPYVFRNKGVVYIPVESVVCVFEVKQDISGNIPDVAEKIESVRSLECSYLDEYGKEKEFVFGGIPRPILGGLLSTDSSLSVKSLANQLSKLKGLQTIDIGCCAKKYGFYVKYPTIDERHSYTARKTAPVHIYNKKIALMVFVFQLLHTLQRNNNVLNKYLINIDAYLKAVDAELTKSPVAASLF